MASQDQVVLFLLFPILIHAKRIFVETNFGLIQGRENADGQKFFGIPYASPPERWMAPTEAKNWTGILKATKYKPMCYQYNCKQSFPKFACSEEMSEDCLYLNIFAPPNTKKTTSGKAKAVMVFIHGGAFSSGAAGVKLYKSAAIARRDVIVVTINYRLGALGFMVTGTSEGDITGNYGLMDQRMAIKWVYENIHSFGGNPRKITLFGQSAGALSIAIHMISGKVDPYFRAAIMESNPLTIPATPMPVAAVQGAGVAAILNCNARDTACLKSRTADQIVEAQNAYNEPFSDSSLRPFVRWVPSIDGDEVPIAVMEAFRTGTFSRKEVIIGSTSEEGQFYVPWIFREALPMPYYAAYIAAFVPQIALQVVGMYPPANPADARPELTQVVTDFLFTCPSFSVAGIVAASGVRTYSYMFDAALQTEGLWSYFSSCEGRVCHSTELAYVFQTAPLLERELKLSDTMIEYWTNFAKTGSPNRDGKKSAVLPRWPRYTQTRQKSMVFDLDNITAVGRSLRNAQCNLWDQTGYIA